LDTSREQEIAKNSAMKANSPYEIDLIKLVTTTFSNPFRYLNFTAGLTEINRVNPQPSGKLRVSSPLSESFDAACKNKVRRAVRITGIWQDSLSGFQQTWKPFSLSAGWGPFNNRLSYFV
jgi:hypothetical protein